MLEAIGALLISIVAMIVDLMAFLLRTFYTAAWVSARKTGLKRFFYTVSSVSALFLFTAMMLAFTGAAGDALLSVIFNRWVMIASLALLVLSICGALAVGAVAEDVDVSNGAVTLMASYVVVFALLMGATSVWATQSERRGLTERICAESAARLSQGIKDQGTKALDLAERLSNRDLRNRLPCLGETGQ